LPTNDPGQEKTRATRTDRVTTLLDAKSTAAEVSEETGSTLTPSSCTESIAIPAAPRP